ncbi:histone-lysine N-methyltransferase SETD1A-like [Amia ocellicauda]|uniref:histone-lysine N-methyltransferase SETD1A-like n=1 Tax=Amia ocellicauda TaxID=2972642 RepID=UPI0034640586
MLSSAVPPPIPRSRLLDNHKRAGEPEPRAPGPGGRGERNNKNTGPSPPILTPAKPPVTSATARPPPPAAWKRPSETGELGESEAEAPTRLHKGAVQAPGVEIDPNCNEPAVPCLCCEPQPPHQPHAPPHDQNHNHNHNRNRHYSQQLDNNNTVAQPQPPPQRQQSPPLSRESRESTGEEEEEEEEEEDVDVDEEEEEEEDDEDDTLVPSCADCPPSLLALSLSSSSSSISSCSDFESDSPDPLSPAASPPDACADLFPGAGRPPHIVPLELPPQSPDEGYPSAHSSHSTSPDHKSILTAALPLAPPELRDKRGEEEEEEEAPVPDSLAPSPLQPSPPLETSPPGLEASSSSSSLTSASLTPSLFSSPSPSPPSLEPNGNTVPSLPPLPPPRHRRRFLALGGSSAVASGPAPLRKPGNAWKVAPPPPSTAPPPSFLALDAEIRRLVEMAGLSRQELPGLGPELSWEGEGEGEGVGIRERERGREGEGLGIGEREGEEERVGKGEREEDRVAGGQGTEEREGEGEGDGAVRPVPRLSAPPRKTSFHEIALRRKRANNNNSSNNNNSNNCTFGPAPRPSVAPPRPPPPVPARPPLPPRPSLPLAARPDRSDWLILFSPDTEFPPRPFGSGQREPSPQKPAGTKVTTFKELRNRSKQQGSAGQNPFALEPEPGPAPLTPDPDFLYSCQSELYAEFRPLPQPAPPTTHAPPQPPSSLDGQQLHPGALQPIAEGASEPESRPPLRIGSSSSDGSLRTVGSGGERQREGEGERDGERERERWGERGRADGGRSWEPRTTGKSRRHQETQSSPAGSQPWSWRDTVQSSREMRR